MTTENTAEQHIPWQEKLQQSSVDELNGYLSWDQQHRFGKDVITAIGAATIVGNLMVSQAFGYTEEWQALLGVTVNLVGFSLILPGVMTTLMGRYDDRDILNEARRRKLPIVGSLYFKYIKSPAQKES